MRFCFVLRWACAKTLRPINHSAEVEHVSVSERV